MMTYASLDARLRKVELQAKPGAPPDGCVWVVTEHDDELPGKLAEMEAAGTYRPDRQGVVHWRIVDPEPRNRRP